MKYRVVRAISAGGGKTIFPGDDVDPSAWRNLRALIAAGKIVVVKETETVAPVDAKPAPAKKASKKIVPEPAVVEDDPK